MVLAAEQDSTPVEAIWFYMDASKMPQPGQFVDLVYQLDINRFRGDAQLQLLVRHLQPRMP